MVHFKVEKHRSPSWKAIIPPIPQKFSVFVLFRPTTVWKRPADIKENSVLYLFFK